MMKGEEYMVQPVVDLQQFCGDPETELRLWMQKPFRVGNWAYATDGIFLVRAVTDVAGNIEELPDSLRYKAKLIERIERYFKRIDAAVFSVCPAALPLQARAVECFDCDGCGKKHECPDCTCVCEGCGGDGENDPERHTTVDFADALLALKYVRQMLMLPSIEIAVGSASADLVQPLLFRFTGGVGALMPCSKRGRNHVDIAPRKDSPIT